MVFKKLEAILDGVRDEIACLATVACEVFHAFEGFHWVGFYRVTEPGVLMVGPYQGGHGCLRIPFERGVCGAAARSGEVQIVDDVNAVQDHIACSSSTRSEIVLPVVDDKGEVVAVFDIDSDYPANFDAVDHYWLGKVCTLLSATCYRAEANSE
ncbi:GAF domain-containing protein [Rubritalea tangerina]